MWTSKPSVALIKFIVLSCIPECRRVAAIGGLLSLRLITLLAEASALQNQIQGKCTWWIDMWCFQPFLLYLNSNVKCQPTNRSSRWGPEQNWFFAYLGRLQISQVDTAGMWATDSHTLARLLFTQRMSLGTLQPSWNQRQPRERIKLKLPGLSGAKETPKECSQTTWCLSLKKP